MKKVILSAFALLTVGVLSAQDNKRTPETNVLGNSEYYAPASGVNNEVFIVQKEAKTSNHQPLSSVDPNEVYVDQSGMHNFSHNAQFGKGQYIDVDQVGQGNIAIVQQEGDGINVVPSQDNTTLVYQRGTNSGNKNVLTIDTDGSTNFVNAYQNGQGNNKNESVSLDPEAAITSPLETGLVNGFWDKESQLGFNDIIDIKGENNTVDLIQKGNNNQANVKLFDFKGEGSSSTIKQGGNNNQAFSFQAGLTGSTSGSKVANGEEPDGENNTSWINQGFNDGYVTAKTEGVIDNPISNYVGGSDNNYAGTQQYGTDNESYVTQLQDWNTSLVAQIGNNNLSNVNQKGTGTKIEEANVADVFQDGAFNEADVNQNGKGNSADVDQTSDGTSASLTNYSKVEQTGGNNNIAKTEQWGANSSKVAQKNGNGNYSKVWQNGEHTSEITQENGNMNWAEVQQMGGSNQSFITQKVGDSNEAYIYQDGNLNSSTLVQKGDMNLYNITQMGDGNISVVNQTATGGM